MIPKFRAWDRFNKKMIDWGNLVLAKDVDDDELYVWTDGIVSEAIIGATLMQSNGLLDKNGIEIFEGDILEVAYGDIHGEANVCKVVAKNPFDYSLNEANWLNHSYQIEVIGNIHENEDLLK